MDQNMQQALDKIKANTEDFLRTEKVTDLIKDNKIEYTYKEVRYRVCMPSFDVKQRVAQARMKKLSQLLRDGDCLLEKDLIALYEKRGISFKEFDAKLEILRTKRNSLNEKLGAGLVDAMPADDLVILKNELKSIMDEQSAILMEKSVLLDSSLESQLNVYVFTYMAALITERCNNEQWVQAWPTYDDFIKEPDALVNQAVWYASIMYRNEAPLE